MKLGEYKAKRKFPETPEPRGGQGKKEGGLIFVVHKHAARHLHYDFRLELEGVLKSWAVPKGPPIDPFQKRLAIKVEDHPFDYKDFEGVIPEGNYGAGSVIIWDRGSYHHPSAEDRKESERLLIDGLAKGNMKLMLNGEKLHGEFALVKIGKDEKSWLLLKKKAGKDNDPADLEVPMENRSVASGRSLEEVAAGAGEKSATKKIERIRLRETEESSVLQEAPSVPMPHRLKPMLTTPIKKPFDHPEWIFEIKWDGYRAVAEIHEGGASLYSRNGILLNSKFAPVTEALKSLGFDAVFDGEIVVTDDEGRPDFGMLQDYGKSGNGHLVYYIFDLIYFQGHDLRDLPLIRRKELLRKILPSERTIKFSDHVSESGILFFKAAIEKGLEGIVAKHSLSPYRNGKRSDQWLKVKARAGRDCVIAGFTEPAGRRKHFGALVLGVYAGKELVYIGHTGGGFSADMLGEVRARIEPLIRKECPFKTVPETNAPVTWLRPEMVCEVAFQGWTSAGLMRQPVFIRLRDDKGAREVVREDST